MCAPLNIDFFIGATFLFLLYLAPFIYVYIFRNR